MRSASKLPGRLTAVCAAAAVAAIVAAGAGAAALPSQGRGEPPPVPVITAPAGSAAVEQRTHGPRPPAESVASFDGLGVGFEGPQGSWGRGGNPSDNSLAVGPDHVVATVNSRMAIFTKKGRRFDATGQVLYGPVNTNNVFRGFGGRCEAVNNGDAVVRYDQIANRWLIVMPLFSRGAARPDQPPADRWNDRFQISVPGVAGQPGRAVALYQPPPPPPPAPSAPATAPPAPARGAGTPPGGPPPAPGARRGGASGPQGVYSMCYAISTSTDPLGPYYRYEFLRPLFPDYPRPAVWPDGYYVPTSTGDNRISPTVATQKHACVVERAKMLRGEAAAEQCVIMENVGFLNNADVDGRQAPPDGAPNVMMAAGGTQLEGILESDVIDVWQFHVDWKDPANTRVTGPDKIAVAPYAYLCGGQLTACVPQPGTERRLDAQGDKIMSRLVYRRIGNTESIVGVHSVNTTGGSGGVRWYEFRIDRTRRVTLRQQGTFAPDAAFRWMASPAIDRAGNIGIGYSFGGTPHFAGQRFAARLAGDPLGQLTLREAVLVVGEAPEGGPGRPLAAQRWEDYTQTAIDPSDDCTIWYVGDYVKQSATSYSSRIGAFRLPGCR